MSRALERLLLWVADLLDRSLLTVPDVDEYPPFADRDRQLKPPPEE
jgi:hypothetical protein